MLVCKLSTFRRGCTHIYPESVRGSKPRRCLETPKKGPHGLMPVAFSCCLQIQYFTWRCRKKCSPRLPNCAAQVPPTSLAIGVFDNVSAVPWMGPGRTRVHFGAPLVMPPPPEARMPDGTGRTPEVVPHSGLRNRMVVDQNEKRDQNKARRLQAKAITTVLKPYLAEGMPDPRVTPGYPTGIPWYLGVPRGTPGHPQVAPGYPGMPRGAPGYPGVPRGTPVYPGVPRGPRGTPRYPGAPRCTPRYPAVARGALGHPGLARETPHPAWGHTELCRVHSRTSPDPPHSQHAGRTGHPKKNCVLPGAETYGTP
jgi:hypothetical protein